MTPAQVSRQTLAWLDSRQATRTTQTLALVALLLSAWFSVQQYQLTRCQAAYAEVSNASQRARALAAESDRSALRTMLNSVAKSPRKSIAAVRVYNASLDAADAQRAANPIPPPPSTNCG